MRIPAELAETLAAIVDEGTLDAAARRLHITPSAVSQRVKALEEQLGQVVLVRSKPARLSERHPVVFELHRDDQDFTARLLESGTVMGAVTSRSTPVAGCRVSELGAMRYEAVATPAFVQRWLPDPTSLGSLVEAPLVDFDRRDDLQTQWLGRQGIEDALPARHFLPASNDFPAAVPPGPGR